MRFDLPKTPVYTLRYVPHDGDWTKRVVRCIYTLRLDLSRSVPSSYSPLFVCNHRLAHTGPAPPPPDRNPVRALARGVLRTTRGAPPRFPRTAHTIFPSEPTRRTITNNRGAGLAVLADLLWTADFFHVFPGFPWFFPLTPKVAFYPPLSRA